MDAINNRNELVIIRSLCAERHDYPEIAQDSIFPAEVRVMDFPYLENQAMNYLKPYKEAGAVRLEVYVSGCQPALIAVISSAIKLDFDELILWHYDNYLYAWRAQRFPMAKDLLKEARLVDFSPVKDSVDDISRCLSKGGIPNKKMGNTLAIY